MESEIIKEIKQILDLPLGKMQRKYYIDLFNALKPVKVVRAADILEDYELDYIRHVIKPKPKECYRNAHLLCEAFPDRFKYCEGKVNVPIPIDHAFNSVDDVYIDITFEFALNENPSVYEYVVFGEYDAQKYIMRFWKPDIMARFTDGRIIIKSPDHTKCEPGRQ